MADEYVVSVGVKADFSDLKAKQAEATASVKEAQTAWEEAYKAFGAAASQGSAQAIAALAEYRAALDSALARQAALTTSNEAFTATSNAATAAAREMSQQTAAASINMRVLEGSTMGCRTAPASNVSPHCLFHTPVRIHFSHALHSPFIRDIRVSDRTIKPL